LVPGGVQQYQDQSEHTGRGTTYRTQRFSGSKSDRASIMFSERLGLSVHGDHGVATTELLTFGEGSATIGRVVSTGHEITLRETENITFLLPLAGQINTFVGRRDYWVHAGQLSVFRPTERRTRSLADLLAGFKAATLQVPWVRMQELARPANINVDDVFSVDAISLHGELGHSLARNLPTLVDDLFLRPSAMVPARVFQAVGRLVDDQISEIIGLIEPRSASKQIFPAFHRVRQAEDIMHAHSDEPLTMGEIALALDVSLRSLQLAFSEVHGGLGPRDVLNRIRLEKARNRLLASEGGRVTTAAMDSGFFHLSRFAQAYARTFGERPSETLARRRS
jgi:AraC-like DNA-binding protein